VIDNTTETVDIFTSAALLAALQIPLIAALPELYRRTQNQHYRTARKLSLVSSLGFMVVAFASVIYLIELSAMNGLWLFAILYGGLGVGVILIAIGLAYASGFKVVDADAPAALEKPKDEAK
jgi:hypothetical protein